MSLATSMPARPRSIDRVLDALGAQGLAVKSRGRDDFMACCPVHEDQTPSMHVTYDRGAEQTQIYCHGCEAPWDEIVAALGLPRDALFDRPLEKEEREHRPKRAPKKPARPALPARLTKSSSKPAEPKVPAGAWRETVYSYADEDGNLRHETVRLEADVDGQRLKRFFQRFVSPKTGDMVKTKPAGFAAVLYNQADVLQAIAAGRPVYVVEGEKDADSGTAAGLVTTTNAMGATSFPTELAQLLAGGDIHVVVDRDLAGAQRAVRLYELLEGLDTETQVTLYLPATTEDKSDLTDHFDAGHGVQDLVEITPDDAKVLVQVGTTRKIVESSLRIAADEARAQHEAGDEDAAKLWAGETDRLLGQVHESTNVRRRELLLSPAGEQAVTLLGQLRREATRLRGLAQNVVPISPAVTAASGGSGGDDEDTPFDGGSADDGVFIKRPQYAVVDGDTVRISTDRDGNPVYNLVMEGWAEVQEVATYDDGEDAFDDPDEIKPTRARDYYRVTFFCRQRDQRGNLVRTADGRTYAVHHESVTFDRDSIRNGSWVQMLPARNQLASTTTRGRADGWDAIMKARPSTPAATHIAYSRPGWRRTDMGPIYVQRSGAITKNGLVDVPVRFDANGPYRGYDLPAPTDDRDALNEAWREGVLTLKQHLPARIAVPLMTAVWTSVFVRTPLITELVGARAAVKTGTAALLLQFLTPVIYHGGTTRKAQLSGTDSGSSALGLPLASAQFGHCAFIIDDFAPDEAPEKVRKKQTDLKRSYYDAPARVVGTRDQGSKQNKPIVGTPILTGELTSSGSVATRSLKLPLSPGDIPRPYELYPKLESALRRHSRGLLGASLIQHIARHWDELHGAWEASDGVRPAMINEWVERLADAPYGMDLRGRFAEDLATRHHAAQLMLTMMRDAGALSVDDAAEFEQWVIEGLHGAAMLQESVAGDPGLQILTYLREALVNGTAFVSSRDLVAPEDPIAGSLGWRPRDVFNGKPVWESTGRERIGVVDADRLMLFPSTAVKVARAAATAAGETLSETAVSIGSSFIAHGWMTADSSGKQSVRARIGGAVQRVWDIPLAALLEEEPPTPPAPPAANEPITPVDDAPSAALPPELPAPSAPTQELPPTEPTPAPAPPTERPERDAAAGSTADSHAVPSPIFPAPQKGHEFRAALGVLDADGLWLPDGTFVNIGEVIGEVQHLGSFAHLAHRLNLGAWVDGWQASTGTIYLDRDAALLLGVPVDELPKFSDKWQAFLKERTTGNPLITAAVADGWSIGGGDSDEPFINSSTSVWMKSSTNDAFHVGVKIALLDALRDDFDPIRTDEDEERLTDPVRLAQRLQLLADQGLPFKMSASTTAANVMKATLPHAARRAFLAPSKPTDPARAHDTEGDFNWTRKPTPSEAELPWLHAFDRSGSYLAAMAGLNFGAGAPEHITDGAAYVPGKQAYYRVSVPEAPNWTLPHPLGRWAPRRVGQDMWVAAPTLELVLDPKLDLDLDVEILEAYVWTDSRRYLNKLYETLRDARAHLDTQDPDAQAARDVVKAMYTRMIGMWGSEEYMAGREGYAPERRHAIIAKARANIYRKVLAIGTSTGRWPLAMQTDSILYASDVEDPTAAWPGDGKDLGRGLGRYKPEATVQLAEHLEFFTGEEYRGKRALGLNDEGWA